MRSRRLIGVRRLIEKIRYIRFSPTNPTISDSFTLSLTHGAPARNFGGFHRGSFARFYGYERKADLSKGCRNPKRKLRVTTHFPEIHEKKILHSYWIEEMQF